MLITVDNENVARPNNLFLFEKNKFIIQQAIQKLRLESRQLLSKGEIDKSTISICRND